MLNIWKCLLAGYLVLIPFFSFALSDQEKKEHMISNLEFVKNTFQVCYAPTEWKQKYSGWDLETEFQSAKEKIASLNQPNAKKFQKILKEFLQTAKDYHVGARFFSTESATLPFRVKGANRKYFFSYIDRKRLSPHTFPFNEGDELVYFDGRPTDEVVTELKKSEVGNANENTDLALAEFFLTNRSGSRGDEVPRGPVMVTIKPVGSDNHSSFQLIWNYTPEKLTSALSLVNKKPKLDHSKPAILQNPIFQKQLITPIFKDLEVALREDHEARDMVGSKKSFIPKLGRIWWETDPYSSFHAYLFENEDSKLIGYIRIPYYLGDEDQVAEFSAIINFFEERSDALVIDQINNPGGSAFYLYALASMLSDQPLRTPKHRMKITSEDVFAAIQDIPLFERIQSDDDARQVLGETLEGTPVTYQMSQFILNYFRFLVEEWNAGRTLTNPFYLYGIDRINPDPETRYTKPILLLVNHLDFSCGDFFPAILQDNKRVTILGTRTAGAGGYVSSSTFPNLYGIDHFHYSASVAERPDKNPIENLGVTPDIIYEITQDDLQYGYKDYTRAIQKAIDSLIK